MQSIIHCRRAIFCHKSKKMMQIQKFCAYYFVIPSKTCKFATRIHNFITIKWLNLQFINTCSTS